MTDPELIALVRELRSAQRGFFAASGDARMALLRTCKRLEVEVDRELKRREMQLNERTCANDRDPDTQTNHAG